MLLLLLLLLLSISSRHWNKRKILWQTAFGMALWMAQDLHFIMQYLFDEISNVPWNCIKIKWKRFRIDCFMRWNVGKWRQWCHLNNVALKRILNALKWSVRVESMRIKRKYVLVFAGIVFILQNSNSKSRHILLFEKNTFASLDLLSFFFGSNECFCTFVIWLRFSLMCGIFPMLVCVSDPK